MTIFNQILSEIIDRLHHVGFQSDGIILNAAAHHTSVGIGDAVKAIKTKVIEVHILNTFSREDFRHNSFITPCKGSYNWFRTKFLLFSCK